MSHATNGSSDPIKQLRKEMGFWDVLPFNVTAVLGPRWIAAAAHNGTSSISLWFLAAVFFFMPTVLVVTELSRAFRTKADFVSLIPPGGTPNKLVFEVKLVSWTATTVIVGLLLYLRGARQKSRGPMASGA